jgi:transposase-like protein
MMARWQGQYVAWKGRSLCDEDLRYLWADGFHLKGGLAGGRSALLVLAGGLRDGRIIILDLETGPMDASEPWKAMLRNLKKRGLREPALCVAPADLGVWPAVREAFPGTQRQWCWNHVVDSVLVRLPAGLREAAQIELRGMAAAGCESEARRKKQRFCAQHVREWPEAIETLDQAWSHLVRLYRFPLRQREILANTAVIGSPLVALQLLNGGSRAGSGTPNTMAAIWKLLRVAEAGFPKLERVKPSSDWAVPGPVLASRVDVGR